jgi:hypothetical protein
MTMRDCYYLEYFCACLTSVTFWFLLFRATKAQYAEARKVGGPFLFQVRKPLWKQYQFFLMLLPGLIFIPLQLVLMIFMDATLRPMSLMNIVIMFSIPFYHYPWTRIAFEIREGGLLALRKSLRRKILISWREIAYGKWIEAEGVLSLHLHQSTETYPLLAADARKALDILGRFIEIRNEREEVIYAGKPEPMDEAEAAALKQYQDRRPLQFSILSMLLLTVVVAAGAGWYAIALEYIRLQQNALNALSGFSPRHYNDICGSVRNLDFAAKLALSPSSAPPANTTPNITDADIALIKPFHRLGSLSLIGCDITDAAIPDLVALRSLHDLWISGTKVTPEGLERLKKEMPHTAIH